MQLNLDVLQHLLARFFPDKNNFGEPDYNDLIKELADFGINTTEPLQELLQKHVDEVMKIDAESLDEENLKWFSEENIPDLEEKMKHKFWFNWAGLLRVALELEFGEAYRNYSFKRDGLED